MKIARTYPNYKAKDVHYKLKEENAHETLKCENTATEISAQPSNEGCRYSQVQRHCHFNKVFKKAYGEPSGPELLNNIEAVVKRLNSDGIAAKVDTCKMCFMDATGMLDCQNCRVFLLLTHCCAGGVPLACFILTSEARDVLEQALNSLKSLIGKDGFFGQGPLDPELFLKDDLLNVRPYLLFTLMQHHCCVHFTSSKPFGASFGTANTSSSRASTTPFQSSKAMMYAKTVDNLTELYTQMNNDKLLERMRAYNVPQPSTMNVWLTQQIIALSVHSTQNTRWQSLPLLQNPLFPIKKIGDTEYEVPSENTDCTYTVDIELGLCSCPVGCSGDPCKHQFVVKKTFQHASWNFLPTASASMHKLLHKIATGNDSVSEEWFQPLRCEVPSTATSASNDPIERQETSACVNTENDDIEVEEDVSDAIEVNDELIKGPDTLMNDPGLDIKKSLGSDDLISSDRPDDLKSKLWDNPNTLSKHIESFIKNYNELNGLASVLVCFGKYNGVPLAQKGGRINLLSALTYNRNQSI
ncbi:hypothetical protein CAPTEDRAFT_209047 [Capitella teleta]|uniref:SWIM-type domain-containing protein n=1 Tax=Capitella teleta TaxID=283909 RepID=R7TP27_CAPTE|nr:hypothetical protein CAPTEDRAFT_209047 [Capitella teleta]|eukprot:ELT93281.1 hypothetical protein CAPTEDRAFT_209047 [Capitella teleta]